MKVGVKISESWATSDMARNNIRITATHSAYLGGADCMRGRMIIVMALLSRNTGESSDTTVCTKESISDHVEHEDECTHQCMLRSAASTPKNLGLSRARVSTPTDREG